MALASCSTVLGIGDYRACEGGECLDAETTGDVAEASACMPQPQQVACQTFPEVGCDGGNCEVANINTGATICTAAGTRALWNNCNGLGQCAPGTACVGGVCKPYCCSSADCGGRVCSTVVNNGTTLPIPGFTVCNAGCDPMNPSAICGPQVTCFPSPWNGTGNDEGNCFGPAGNGIGDGGCNGTPSGLLQCAPGYYCTTDAVCRKWCRVGFDSDCPSDAGVCMNFNKAPFIDNVEYGVCF